MSAARLRREEAELSREHIREERKLDAFVFTSRGDLFARSKRLVSREKNKLESPSRRGPTLPSPRFSTRFLRVLGSVSLFRPSTHAQSTMLAPSLAARPASQAARGGAVRVGIASTSAPARHVVAAPARRRVVAMAAKGPLVFPLRSQFSSEQEERSVLLSHRAVETGEQTESLLSRGTESKSPLLFFWLSLC